MVVGRGGAAGGVAPGSQRFPQEGSLQLSRVGASARQGRRSFLFTPIPKGGLLILNNPPAVIGVGGRGSAGALPPSFALPSSPPPPAEQPTGRQAGPGGRAGQPGPARLGQPARPAGRAGRARL